MNSYSTGAIVVAILSLGQEGSSRMFLHVCALIFVALMVSVEIRNEMRADKESVVAK